MEPKTRSAGGEHILYDASALQNPQEELWPRGERGAGADDPAVGAGDPGRGAVRFRALADGTQAVLRHYRRGGWIAHLSRDRYLGLALERTRPWREWRLLAHLYRLGLPVPRPVAARVVRAGPAYRGDLATARLPGCRTLGQILQGEALAPAGWERVGRTIRRFHDAGAEHPDLNAHNVLLDADGGVYLLDFDRGRLRRPAGRWQRANLRRLRRSLDKLAGETGNFHFKDEDWAVLLEGYAGEEGPEGPAGLSAGAEG
ncbi:MAG: 3-deoxy-D-manno-octulosonic acid kinase [Thiohalorhabdus sp.]|uniref:3-deoxy-D-manno-octulosonic acid kinase n=1 Tax=Thiohalorhabdus sp. TaxID=3094134 RepID=UPI00397EB1E6